MSRSLKKKKLNEHIIFCNVYQQNMSQTASSSPHNDSTDHSDNTDHNDNTDHSGSTDHSDNADHRAYILGVLNDNCVFIALNQAKIPCHLDLGLIFIEEWTNDKHRFELCRVSYPQRIANEWIKKKQENKLGLMEGPDFYVLTNKDKIPIIYAWQTNVGDAIEISFNQASKYLLLDSKIPNEQLFIHMKEMLEHEYGKLTITPNPKTAYLLKWQF